MKSVNKLDLAFCIVIVLVIVVSGTRTIFFPKDTIKSENKVAQKITKFTIQDFLSNTYQDNIETALADQFPMGERIKAKYRRIYSGIKEPVIEKINENNCKNNYINYGEFFKYNCEDFFVLEPESYKTFIKDLDISLDGIKSAVNNNADTKFYLYYIEKDTDINFTTLEKSGIYKYISEELKNNNIVTDYFGINSFEEFKRNFYVTDHHWNNIGSYQGYKDIMKLLNKENEILTPKGEVCENRVFTGSKIRLSGNKNKYKEKQCTYTFDMNEPKTYINGIEETYGSKEQFINKEIIYMTYGDLFGQDEAEIRMTGRGKENILVLGDSFDNAIINLISNSYKNLYSVDLRHYERRIKKAFDLKEYITENDIDTVLLVGAGDFYHTEVFRIKE